MICPNCGRRNQPDSAYCAQCGFRLPSATARGAGITYRKALQAEPHGGGGQGLLAFAAVLIAGVLFIGAALAIFLSAPRPSATPTRVATVDKSPVSSLPVFTQPTATPSPAPSPSPVPSFFIGPTPTLGASPSASLPSTATPTPTATVLQTPSPPPPPTPTPTAPPTPTPTPTPVDCSRATGKPTKYVVLNSRTPTRTVPGGIFWCLDGVRIQPGSVYGNVVLAAGNRGLFGAVCQPGTCAPTYERIFSPNEFLIKSGKTLVDRFTCVDNPLTPILNECTDPRVPPGAVITIGVEVFPAP